MCARMTDVSVCQDNTNNEDNTAAAPVAKKEENTVPISPTRKLSVASKIGHARLRQRMPSIHLRSMRESQLNVVAHIAGKDEQVKRRLKWVAAFCMLIALVVMAANTGTTAAMIFVMKDMHVYRGVNDGLHPTASDGHGSVVLTGTATYDLPLFVAPVLPDEELFSVDKIRLTLPDIEYGEDAVNSFRIAKVVKVNSTVVVFHALGGEQIHIVNGITTVRLSATGDAIPVCSASVTCAAFQVDSSALAEKYVAEAEALLAPFAEGRRLRVARCARQKWGGWRYTGQLG